MSSPHLAHSSPRSDRRAARRISGRGSALAQCLPPSCPPSPPAGTPRTPLPDPLRRCRRRCRSLLSLRQALLEIADPRPVVLERLGGTRRLGFLGLGGLRTPAHPPGVGVLYTLDSRVVL